MADIRDITATTYNENSLEVIDSLTDEGRGVEVERKDSRDLDDSDIRSEVGRTLDEDTDIERSERQDDKLKPLKFWDDRTKDYFSGLSNRGKKVWLNSFKIIEKAAAKEVRSMEEKLAPFNALIEEVAPHMDRVSKAGLSAAQYVKNLISRDLRAMEDPKQFILETMALLQVTPNDLVTATKDYKSKLELYRQTHPIKEELDSLKRSMGGGAQQEHPQGSSQDYSDDPEVKKIVNFFSQVDRDGKPRYPKWLELKDTMATISQTTGEENLDTLYRKAYSAIYDNGETVSKPKKSSEFGNDGYDEDGFRISTDGAEYIEDGRRNSSNRNSEDEEFEQSLMRQLDREYFKADRTEY
jgi:hypothetical protein